MSTDLLRLAADSRFRRPPFLLFVAAFLVFNVLAYFRQSALEQDRRASLLQADLTANQARNPRYDQSVGRNLTAALRQIPDATRQPLVILAGMSQMYAINELVLGDETITEHLDDHYAPLGTRVYGLAAPNLDNEEALLLLLASISGRLTTPRFFIYGVCFDKFRNIGVRPDMQAFLRGNATVNGLWRDVAQRAAAKYPVAAESMIATLTQIDAAPVSDFSVEKHIRGRVGTAIPLVKARSDLNAYFQERLYRLRNTVFRISNTSKRPILQSRYDLNREFMGVLSDVAAEHGVRLVTYVIPLNPQAETPYVPEQYEAFKTWFATFSRERRIPFANLEQAVPADHWGLLNGSPDFKHFKEAGHRITALAIREKFDSVILQDKTGASVH